MKPVIVIGHKNPDTDSICSAICYADLKSKLTGGSYLPCRAGKIHSEAKYVLETFGVEEPRFLDSLEPTLADVQFRTVAGVTQDMSLKQAWEHMRQNNIRTVPVLDENQHIKGMLTMGDIARFYIEDQNANALAEARTSYRNIVDALSGTMVVGDMDADFTVGRVSVAAANPEVMEELIEAHDMIILGNRYESQLCAIEMHAGCLIVVLGAKVTRTIQNLAEQEGCTIISTPLDTYTCAKIINQAVPVRHVMCTNELVSFHADDLAADVKSIVSKKRIRYFPILDHSDRYIGVVSQRNLLDMERQQVILVDHNERDQAVDGIHAAEVLEIIDHHRIDAVETRNPIYFRNQPLGCTATIIAQMYEENGVDIEPHIAGLLCSAILSDTLMFRSPTCTEIDKRTATRLAACAGIDLIAHGTAMFNAGSHLDHCSPDSIFHMDYKVFHAHEQAFAVAQVTSVSESELGRLVPRMQPYMRDIQPSSGLNMMFLMLTNILEESTQLLFVGKKTDEIVRTAFHVDGSSGAVTLPGVVSRKKQMITRLIAAMDEIF